MTSFWERHRPPAKGTALGRPIDFRYASNRLAVAGAAAAGGVAGIATLLGDAPDIVVATRVGVGVFLAWAVSRELVPDHPATAAVAMAGAAALAIADVPAIGVNVVALIAVRAWAGTVGHHPSMVDLVGVVALAAFAGTDPAMWPAGIALAAGIVAHSPHRVAATATAVLMVAAGGGAAAVRSPDIGLSFSVPEAAAIAGVAGLLAAALPIATVRSTTDRRNMPIRPVRVTSGWLVAALVLLGAAAFDRILVAGPLAAAMAVSAVPLIGRRIRSRNRR